MAAMMHHLRKSQNHRVQLTLTGLHIGWIENGHKTNSPAWFPNHQLLIAAIHIQPPGALGHLVLRRTKLVWHLPLQLLVEPNHRRLRGEKETSVEESYKEHFCLPKVSNICPCSPIVPRAYGTSGFLVAGARQIQ